jgi:hypothetical protein
MVLREYLLGGPGPGCANCHIELDVNKTLDSIRRLLPGEDVRYFFPGTTTVHPLLEPVVFVFDFMQIPIPGTHEPRVVGITTTETVVMRAGMWTRKSRHIPREVLYREPRRRLGPLTDRFSSVITIGHEDIRIYRSAYSVIERANAELAEEPDPAV